MLNIRSFFVLLPLRHKSNLQQPTPNAPNTHGHEKFICQNFQIGIQIPEKERGELSVLNGCLFRKQDDQTFPVRAVPCPTSQRTNHVRATAESDSIPRKTEPVTPHVTYTFLPYSSFFTNQWIGTTAGS